MAKTMEQLQDQIAKLQQQAAALKSKEVPGVVARIKIAIEHYGLTAQDLGFAGPAVNGALHAAATIKTGRVVAKKRAVNTAAATAVPVVNGGVVSKKRAVKAVNTPAKVIANGTGVSKKRAVKAVAATTTPVDNAGSVVSAQAPKKRAKMAAGVIRFRDEAGNSWTGMGTKPKWFVAAIAAGKTVDDLKVKA